MSARDQSRKYSPGADVFPSSPKSGHCGVDRRKQAPVKVKSGPPIADIEAMPEGHVIAAARIHRFDEGENASSLQDLAYSFLFQI